jgi:hypothetical protein
MTTGDKPPDARPVFRKFALGLAIVLFVLAAVFKFATPELENIPSVICLVVGFIMLLIGGTGYWPPRFRE